MEGDLPCPGTELADGSTRTFPPAHVTVDRLSSMITGGIIGSIVSTIALMMIFLGNLPASYKWTPLIPAGLLLCFLAYRAFAWPQISHRHKSWSLSNLGIHLTQGVIWRSTTSVPRARVQHTDVGQGPLQRRFGIATLSIHTAGSDQAQVNLSGLNYDDAIAVRDFLILREPVTQVHDELNEVDEMGQTDRSDVAIDEPGESSVDD
ncbi:MAG: membrane protein YdbS with pleckstrin-like domain [Bacteroidia bacterium]|jgi:membrane protein YdbS with pleckstrin-like domain